MKKSNLVLVLSFFLSFFLSCNEESSLDELKISETTQKDVYVENDILVFKNDAVFDSINKEVNQFTDEQFENWQNSLGFVSAEKYFEPIFDEFDNVQSKQELEDFVDEYKDKMYITKDDDGMYSIDYPLSNMLWLRLMNKDGVFQIGKILHSYEKNYIAVLDGDMNKLKIAKQNPEIYAGIQGENTVYIEQTPNLKSDFYNDFDGEKETYKSWPAIVDGRFRLIVRLECISRWMSNNSQLKALPYIWVKSEHKGIFGGWNRRRSLFEITTFAAMVKYPGPVWDYNGNGGIGVFSCVTHCIHDGENFESENKRYYGSFVFDEYIRDINGSNGEIAIPISSLDIDVDFMIAGSNVVAERCYFGLLEGDLSNYPTYKNGYPVWHVNN